MQSFPWRITNILGSEQEVDETGEMVHPLARHEMHHNVSEELRDRQKRVFTRGFSILPQRHPASSLPVGRLTKAIPE